ncbi:hypothetical protein Vadar_023252 [Vaccinium darrowii]|uniref:Uncharacterized protein n=1 Tax=Vaccinium darrowii TaxID=229202 RepID=A0ACB7YY02_9ERIC|nr:hypothetical protein Vadar_023252 [Vaccinium darrowii]
MLPAERKDMTTAEFLPEILEAAWNPVIHKRYDENVKIVMPGEGEIAYNLYNLFFTRTADVTGKVKLPENVKMVTPRDNVTAVFKPFLVFLLKQPNPSGCVLREGGRGVVSKVLGLRYG